MAHKRITMQDIADACGLSRNTVSKVFNAKGAVPDTTRHMVMQKARELGYHQFPDDPAAPGAAVRPQQDKSVALLTRKMPSDYHFATFFLSVFTEQLSRAGYTLTLYEVAPEEMARGSLPSHMALERIAGILGLELFDRPYLEMLCGLRIPTLFVDAYAGAVMHPLECDLISMENQSSVAALTAHAIEKGAKRPGFVGDAEHCNSFQERWNGFRFALEQAGMPLRRELCILADDASPYGDPQWLAQQLRAMPAMPDALFCANDFIALHLLSALKLMGLSVPEDVMLAGFDGTPQSAVVEPSLTTVQIPNAEIGRIAAEMLLDRIANPDRPFRTLYLKTTPILRGSTR